MLSDFVHYQHLKPSIDGCGISVRTHARAHKAITPGLPGLRQKHPEEKNLINQNLALYTAEVDRQNPAPVSHLYNGIRFRSAGYIDPSPL